MKTKLKRFAVMTLAATFLCVSISALAEEIESRKLSILEASGNYTYVKKGNGVSVHKKSCVNMKGIDTRLISVSWNMNSDNSYISKLKIYTNESKNNLIDIVTKASLKNVIVSSINEFNKDNNIGYNVVVKVKNIDDLEDFKESVRILPFVLKVEVEG